MEITLKNVGLIRNSTVKIDGLTVITGENNSGKSTVGKALYAVIEGMRDVEGKMNEAVCKYFLDIRDIMVKEYFSYGDELTTKDSFEKLSKIKAIYLKKMFSEKKFRDYSIKETMVIVKDFLTLCRSIEDSENIFSVANIRKLEFFIDICEKMNLEQFSLNSICQILNAEFKKQIYPINGQVSEDISTITIRTIGEADFQIALQKEGTLVESDSHIMQMVSQNVIMVDDPYVLDGLKNDDTSDLCHHVIALKKHLKTTTEKSIIEQEVWKRTYSGICEKISTIIPGHMVELDGNFYYTDTNDKTTSVRIENLATGSKLLAILNTLFEHGCLDFNTVLILDEPESHLHPEWQNRLARIVVLLIKELGIKVLLTTHSINFVLALETYMYEYDLADVSNFYITEKDTETGMVDYKNTTHDLEEIYAGFVRSFSRMKAERSKYMDD